MYWRLYNEGHALLNRNISMIIHSLRRVISQRHKPDKRPSVMNKCTRGSEGLRPAGTNRLCICTLCLSVCLSVCLSAN